MGYIEGKIEKSNIVFYQYVLIYNMKRLLNIKDIEEILETIKG